MKRAVAMGMTKSHRQRRIEHRISLTLAFPWPSRVTLHVCLQELHSAAASSTHRKHTANDSILQLRSLSAEPYTDVPRQNNATMTKEAFIVPTGRSPPSSQRFRSLFPAFISLIGTMGLEDIKASQPDSKSRTIMSNVLF